MSQKLVIELENATNVAYTENGAKVSRTTKSALLDFFSTGGALRNRNESEVIKLFQKAFFEDPTLAVKSLFYFRDIRGGQGERKLFNTIAKWLATDYPNDFKKNIKHVAEYGRWDDLYVFVGTPLENSVIEVFKSQLEADMKSDNPSLLAKWLKSENASSKETKRLATWTRKALGLNSKRYRKLLSALRQKINLVEQHMSNNDWDGIEYDKIPSKAGLQYRKAFFRHDENRYRTFLQDVANGNKTINAGTLYPYEIVEKCNVYSDESETLDAMWNNLPDYFDGTDNRGLVVADVSGSMTGRPMDVSISLAMYTAERNKGVFYNKFITFSERPSLQSVVGNTIVEKVNNLRRADWDMSTNLEAVFELILNTAIKGGLSQEDLPTHLYIVSDMEFDSACGNAGYYSNHKYDVDDKFFDTIRQRYESAGFELPFLVFWNVNSRNEQQPMSMDDRGFQLVSGCSPSIFTSLLSSSIVSAYDLMLEVINSERYAPINM